MKITFKSVLIGLAALLGIAGFCMMFLSPLTLAPGLDPSLVKILNEVGFNDGKVAFDAFYFGGENAEGHILGVIGFALMLVGAIAAIAIAFISKKPKVYIWVLILGILAAGLFAVGGILALCVKSNFISDIMASDAMKVLTLGGQEQLVSKFTDALNQSLALGNGPMIGGILGLVAALFTLIASFLPGPKSAKKAKRK